MIQRLRPPTSDPEGATETRPRSRSAPKIRLSFNQRPLGVWTIRIVTFAVILTSWELYGRTMNRALFAPPSRTVEAFVELAIDSNELWHALGDSVTHLLIGFALAVVVGMLIGLLMGHFRLMEYLLDPYVSFLYALPMIVIVPLLIIWLGLGAESRIAIIFAVAIVPVILNTMAGAKRVSENLMDVARNYEATKRQMLRSVVLPSVLPYIFTGINVGIGTAIVGMILGEMLLVIQGLGGMVVTYSNFFQPHKVFVPLLVIVGLSVGLTSILRFARRRLMPWGEVLSE